MKKRFIAIATAGMLLLTGCVPKVEAKDLMQDVKSRAVSGVEDLTTNNEMVTDFAIRLFQKGLKEGENTSVSPLSILSALAMTANGANGETRTQMETAFGVSIEELNRYLYSYTKALPQGEDYQLKLANSIWFTADERFSVTQDFLQQNADYYGADIYQTAFDKEALQDINGWVKEKTDGMIPEIIDKIPKDAVMYLLNALAFEAKWQEAYRETQVRKGVFTLENGSDKRTQSVTYMYGKENGYLEDEFATGFLKYYKDGKYAFVAMLPKENVTVAEYVASLNGTHMKQLLEGKADIEVDTAIPKFEAEFQVELSDVLKNMGMKDAFDENRADFSGIGTYDGKGIYINQVLHKTYLSVGEQGTKAGAATAVEMVEKSSLAPKPNKKVYLERPFVYLLIDCETNIPFFIGTMMNVNESLSE